MKELLKYFGYFYFEDLKSAAISYSENKYKKGNRILTEGEPTVDRFLDSTEINYQGIGAIDFATKFIEGKL